MPKNVHFFTALKPLDNQYGQMDTAATRVPCPFFAMKHFLIATTLVCSALSLTAQRAHVAYLELGGNNGALYSLNYDLRFADRPTGWGFRVGGSYLAFSNFQHYSVGQQLNYIIAKGQHGAEFGAGAIYYRWEEGNNDNTYFRPTLSAMYRYQHARGFNFRLGWSPIFRDNFFKNAGRWEILRPGVSFGYRF